MFGYNEDGGHHLNMIGFKGAVDIEIYEPEEGQWAQARYLAHGHHDVLWTDDLDEALAFIKASIESMCSKN